MRVVTTFVLSLAATLLIAAAALEAQTPGAASKPAPTAQAAPKGDVENGKKIYSSYGCYQCHGYVGQGGAGARSLHVPHPSRRFRNMSARRQDRCHRIPSRWSRTRSWLTFMLSC